MPQLAQAVQPGRRDDRRLDDGGTVDGGGRYYSCPLVYSWDGTRWRLDSGTFGGAIARAWPRTDVDNRAYAAAERTSFVSSSPTSCETDHVDELAVLVVDHSPGSASARHRRARSG